MFCKKKGILRNFLKFARKHLCQILFFIKVAGLMPATSLKQRLWHRCFPVNFTKFLRKFFLLNTSGRILLLFYLPASNDNGITWCLVQQLLRSTELCITTIRSSKDFIYVFIILFKVDRLIGIQQKQYLFILLLSELQE